MSNRRRRQQSKRAEYAKCRLCEQRVRVEVLEVGLCRSCRSTLFWQAMPLAG